MNSQNQVQLDFDSDDSEGSDVSFESSFDEQLEQEFDNVLQQKQIVQFKDQMERMLQMNPELGNLHLEKPQVEDEDHKKQPSLLHRRSTLRTQVQLSPKSETKSAPKVLPMWNEISKNILTNAKKVGSMPSLEEFQQRINLFRTSNDKSDVVDLIIQEQDKIQRDIQQQDKRNKAIENAVHESIEAKVRKETGDVGYVSYRKKIQFQFRIKKAEQLAQEKVQKQQQKKETDMLKSISVFEQLFKDKNYEEQIDMKNTPSEELYAKVRKCNDDIEVKQTILKYIIDHRKKQIDEYKNKPKLLKPTKFISEDCRDFSLLQPNMQIKQLMAKQGFKKEILDKKDDLEGEDIYILTKINQVLEGNLMKLWKNKLGTAL